MTIYPMTLETGSQMAALIFLPTLETSEDELYSNALRLRLLCFNDLLLSFLQRIETGQRERERGTVEKIE